VALARINLSANEMGDAGAAALAEAVARSARPITHLHLARNKITAVGAAAIAAAVAKNPSMRVLSLEHNHIGDDGAAALADALRQNPLLEWLDVCENNISDTGVLRLTEVLATRQTALQVLQIGSNPISDVGALALASAHVRSSQLNMVLLDFSRATAAGYKALRIARAVAPAVRCTTWLLGRSLPCGSPSQASASSSTSSDKLTVGRFMLERDGDHAIWSRVVAFLC